MNDGGPAFPCSVNEQTDSGMSLRDWFAGMAAQGMIASPAQLRLKGEAVDRNPEIVALAAYEIADALLAERGKTK